MHRQQPAHCRSELAHGVHDQFSVGCADVGSQACLSQVHARQKLPEDYESTLFQKSDDSDTVVGKSNDGFICLLRNGYVESRVPKHGSEQKMQNRKTQCKTAKNQT